MVHVGDSLSRARPLCLLFHSVSPHGAGTRHDEVRHTNRRRAHPKEGALRARSAATSQSSAPCRSFAGNRVYVRAYVRAREYHGELYLCVYAPPRSMRRLPTLVPPSKPTPTQIHPGQARTERSAHVEPERAVQPCMPACSNGSARVECWLYRGRAGCALWRADAANLFGAYATRHQQIQDRGNATADKGVLPELVQVLTVGPEGAPDPQMVEFAVRLIVRSRLLHTHTSARACV